MALPQQSRVETSVSNKRPVFILSLDCEGLWGLANLPNAKLHKDITNENLSEVYQKLLGLLERHNIKATFAFVASFVISLEEFQRNTAWYRSAPINGELWLNRFHLLPMHRRRDGWFHPGLMELVQNNSQHEIASHGFTHIPLAEALVPKEMFIHEMECMKEVFASKGEAPKTLVYPINQIGYETELKRFGIKGYRDNLAKNSRTMRQRLSNLTSEANIYQKCQAHSKAGEGAVAIPAGFFLNWRLGARGAIPASVTLKRWKHMLSDAIESEGVAHLWTHPHNFITGKGQFEMLDSILAMVAREQTLGNIDVCTQEEYCSRIE